jgi:acyl-coenzyme A thioesterase PaaI-like protein
MTTMDPQQAAVLDGVRQLGERLPFNRHLGVEVIEVVPGRARTRLPENEALANHVGGVHAIAELAPVELAGALALSSRVTPLFERGYVPVVGGLQVRYTAPAVGDLVATAEVGDDVLAAALAAADAGDRPRFDVEVSVTDPAGTEVLQASLHFVFILVAPA